MRKPSVFLMSIVLLGFPVIAASAGGAVAPEVAVPGGADLGPLRAGAAGSASHPELVALYETFRDARLPEVADGLPDYSPAAMARQLERLGELQRELAAMDTAGWSLADQVDYRVVEAEMRGMEFEHRVTRPWLRDPAFYAVINFQFGPKMHRSLSLPSLPMAPERLREVRTGLEAIPVILADARRNLTDPVADLARIAIYTTGLQLDRLERFTEGLPDSHPELVASARAAQDALEAYRGWLVDARPGMRDGAGVGIEHYDWYLEHVMLLPYTWNDLLLLSTREYEHAVAMLKLMEHRNRHVPVLEPVTSRDTYLARFNAAMAHYHRFLVESELFTLPEYIGPPPVSSGGWSADSRDDYFQTVMDRYTLPLSGHGRGHTIDAEIRARDDRAIRGANRLYFIDGVRQEAFAIGKENFLYDLGLVDDVPRADELAYNLKAFRAARAIADLRMHSNDFTFDEAFQYTVDQTPYGWAPPDSPTLWHDLELYLRTPLYGVGYVIGPIQIERLMMEVALDRGDAFDLTRFMDEFLEAGLIPLSLISVEMLGSR